MECIEDLLFSPWHEPNSPLVLVSLSREICFWDVRHMVNNQHLNDSFGSQRQPSQRFKKRSQISPKHPMKNESYFTFNPVQNNIWSDKKGPFDHPELLSCIRLIGKAQKLISSPDFSQFVTLDNEGEIYHLKLHDKDLASQIVS